MLAKLARYLRDYKRPSTSNVKCMNYKMNVNIQRGRAELKTLESVYSLANFARLPGYAGWNDPRSMAFGNHSREHSPQDHNTRGGSWPGLTGLMN
jgi:hypothetical protein